jgi:splicing factor, arginine/serine-rich 4/5/6
MMMAREMTGTGAPSEVPYDRCRGSAYMRSPSPRYRQEYSPNCDRRGRYPGYDRRDGAMYERRSPVYDRYDSLLNQY